MTRIKGRRPLTCHHEAGHALARWYFGYSTDRAVVLTVEEVIDGVQVENRRGALVTCEGLVDGHDICGYPFGPLKLADGPPEREAELNHLRGIARDIDLINCLAGVYAEAAYRRISVVGCIFAGGDGDLKIINRLLDAWGWGEGTPENEAAWRLAETRTAALTRSPMGSAAIRSIAGALLERGEVDGDEIAALCRFAYGGRQCAFGAWTDHWPPTLAQIRAGYIPGPPDPSRMVA
jgi:hypothetical protein